MFFYAEGVVCLNKIIISVGSVTYALQAQRLLADTKIHSKLIKLDSGSSPDGCIYGLIVTESDYLNAAILLKKGGIAFSLVSQKFPR